ncbi:MAG: Transcriptional regulator [candidate division WWE3 bacterium GW2011_GWF2_41_45]|uniref:Polymerase nucleotidyl transferase domain-containing protein n=2 Tax=Katanobacteria TaxID=422282 RepID=A0A1F4XEA3_UNCKA|nr:MAG: Transcriptional regulator [candidate division WWE3 bacterium GW2011_GWE1_41_27]KKS08577.1 MAG: Transcriptional regulator [candidate division WWE3 bacterium GW2011_GWF2_41_45]OGC79999.1 MAG: hypothetical protein A3K01_01310 [candidate division WWE3 bacterium RIFOXYD1_FULL_43_17]
MLKNLFVSEVRVKILKLLLLNPTKSYHVRAIVRAVKAEINAVRRELDNLISISLLTKRQSSNKIFYTVDVMHPLFPDLVSILAKDDGVGAEIIKRQKKLGNITYAILSRSYLRGRQSTALDVDLFIVGTVDQTEFDKVIKENETVTGREINYSVMDDEEFNYRKRTNDQFIMKILSQSRAMLIGDEEEFVSVIATHQS